MPRTKPAYPPEFRREAIRLVRASGEEHPIPGIAREIGVSDGTLRNWVNQDEIDSGEREGLTTEEKEELRKLGREVKTPSVKRKRSCEKQRPSSPGRRSGIGEFLQAHRCGEGQLPGGDAVQDARSVQERLLRIAQQAALQQEPPGRRPHREDPRSPRQEPTDLRLPEVTRRVAFARSKVRTQEGSPTDESRRAARLYEGQEA